MATTCISPDSDTDNDIFFSPRVEPCDPLLGDHIVPGVDFSRTNSADGACGSTTPDLLLNQQHNRLKRSSSNPILTRKSRHHDPAIDSLALQRQLVLKTQSREPPARPGQLRRVSTAEDSYRQARPHNTGSLSFFWSSSGPAPSKPRNDVRLRTCMKQGCKSAATTPPNEQLTGRTKPAEERRLRRVKTVDFEGVASKKLLQLWTEEHKTRKALPTKAAIKTSPGFTPKTAKGTVADPAVTRTDVHVVAIAPIRDDGNLSAGVKEIVRATPTMQIVESKSGSYEVVWDDVQPNDDVRLCRKDSAASRGLHQAGFSASTGLEHVNTKLNGWTWRKGGLEELASSPFQPQIVVFPDYHEQSTSPQFECAVEEDENLLIIAPPNSERTSPRASRHASRPSSARKSRSMSFTDDRLHAASHEQTKKADSPQETFVVPDLDPDFIPGSLLDSSRGMRVAPMPRKLSNVDEFERAFQGHRDSLTLYSHICGMAPYVLRNRDSISIARKRMQGRNHAVSAARDVPHFDLATADRSSTMIDFDQPSASTPSNAMKSLRNIDPAPAVGTSRHIRIVE